MKVSIVIPTYNHCEDLLKPCLESIKKYTNLGDVEVLVVANGCVDNTREYVQSLGSPFKLVWMEEAAGYTKATNAGINASTGEYVILLNNDTILLPQAVNQWVDRLVTPFYQDSQVGITGPMLSFCPEAQRDFLIFFCVCIKRTMFEQLGLLDEPAFSPGYGEDTDFCAKLEDAGYKIHSVCETTTFSEPNRMLGDFPIYHVGNVTFKNWPGGVELLQHNNEVLRQRYVVGKPTIEKAKALDGFMSKQELRWLGREAQKRSVIIEVGSWHGRSSRALGDNLVEGGIVYCVDTWDGSVAEQATNHASAKLMDGDHAFYEFMQGNADLVAAKKIVPIRMGSRNAAKLFKEMKIQADMIFIDAGHTYEEVCVDIEAWKDVLKEDGIFCGHDFNAWQGVNHAVSEKLDTFNVGVGTTIWYCSKPQIKWGKPAVYDCFPFNNELDLLEKRFATLYDVVDRFVIVEATKTHGNKDKPLHFNDNLARFAKYLNKVTHIVVDSYPAIDSWSIERHQRDAIMRGLGDCKSNDIVMISDCDEIPNPEAVKKYTPADGLKSFEMDLFYYNEHVRAKDKWREAKILPYGMLKLLTPCGARYRACETIPNGGRHLSWQGNVDVILKKIEDTAHQEYNKDEFKNRERIQQAIEQGKDLFGRPLEYDIV